jgi:hypothetical protein
MLLIRLSPDKILLIEQTLQNLKVKLSKCNEDHASTKVKKVKKAKKSDFQEPTAPKRIKFLPLKSPRRESIPPLKIKLSDIYRIKRLKKIRREEKKKNKRLQLCFVQRGQSIKKEIETPNHEPTIEEATTNETLDIQVPSDQQKSNEAINSHQLRNFSIVLNRISTSESNLTVNPPADSNVLKINKCLRENNEERKIKRKKGLAKRWIRNKNRSRTLKSSSASKKSGVTNTNPIEDSENSSLIRNEQNSAELNSNTPKDESIDVPVIVNENFENRRSPPMIRIRNDLLMPALIPQSGSVLSAFATQQRIRPWLKVNNEHQKNATFCTSMLSNNLCLASLYKCMAQQCDYYTSNAQFFFYHLGCHLKYESHDWNNFLQCPYCSFKTENVEDAAKVYLKHIKDDHGTSR